MSLSSVVEHSADNGVVGSSNLPGTTIFRLTQITPNKGELFEVVYLPDFVDRGILTNASMVRTADSKTPKI